MEAIVGATESVRAVVAAPRDGVDTTRLRQPWRPRLGATLLLAAFFLVTGAAPTSAHQGWFNIEGSPDPAHPYQLRTPVAISQVVFGGLAGSGQIDYYAFSAPAGLALNVYLVVADAPACSRFHPAFALIGPGLRGAGAGTPVPASIVPPAADGAIVVAGDRWGTFYESFTETTFLTGPRLGLPLAGGEYMVAVYDPTGGTGTYGLTLGGEEVPGGDDTIDVKTYERWARCEAGPFQTGTRLAANRVVKGKRSPSSSRGPVPAADDTPGRDAATGGALLDPTT